MNARDVADTLARRVERVLRDRSALDSGVKVIADTLAVASAAPHLDNRSLLIAGLLSTRSQGMHHILGLGLKAGLLEAVAANSYMAHALELDDWLPMGYVHAGAVVVPPALAASEESGVSVETLAKAVAAGYEVAGFIGAMLGRSHYGRWHTTATAGAVGAAAAFTLAYGLGVGESLEAAALALNYTIWEGCGRRRRAAA